MKHLAQLETILMRLNRCYFILIIFHLSSDQVVSCYESLDRFNMWLELILLICGLFALYKWSIGSYNYFKYQKVSFMKPLPLLGSYAPIVFRTETFLTTLTRWYNEFPHEK